MEIKTVFADGIGLVSNDSLLIDSDKLINSVNWKVDESSQGVFEQSQTNLFELTEWKELHDWILLKAKTYWNQLGYKADDLFFTQSWLNGMLTGQSIGWHFHSNSLISGVYYLKTNQHAGGTIFQTTKNPLEGMLQTEAISITEYNCGEIVIPAVQDTAIFFPSYMTHRSQPSFNLNTVRYTLAFNIMPKILGKESHFNWAKF